MATRPSKITRMRIIKAHAPIFAGPGYGGATIRNIVASADFNQAAINYHFGSKEGLYRAVLSGALQVLLEADESSTTPQALPREAALRAFIGRQLRPMLARDERSQSLRIFNWETVRPSPVFRKFMAEEAAPYIGSAAALVRRFLPPEAPEKEAVLGALMVFGECQLLVRDAQALS